MWPDIVNGSLEFCGGFFILLSVIKLYKDKLVRGVSCLGVVFFTGWGYWNLFYYPHLDQWVSFWGGVFLVIFDTFWLGQIIYYQWREKNAS